MPTYTEILDQIDKRILALESELGPLRAARDCLAASEQPAPAAKPARPRRAAKAKTGTRRKPRTRELVTEQVAEVLREHGPLKVSQIAPLIGTSGGALHQMLPQLVEAGIFTKAGPQYALANGAAHN